MESRLALTGSNAGKRLPASGVDRLSTLAVPLQPQGGKSAPLSAKPGLRAERGGGVRQYVHTAIATSRQTEFEGSTRKWIEQVRRSKRFKHLVAVVHSLARCGRDQEAKELMACGRYFRRGDSPCGTVKLQPCRCNSIFCPECASRRARPLQERILKRLRPQKYHYFFLTLTVPNWQHISRKKLDGLIAQFSKLRKLKLWKVIVRGGVYSTEATNNAKTRMWHPHLHVLLECTDALPETWLEELKAAWGKLSGSKYLHIERMYGIDEKGRKRRKVNAAALRELIKYATKAASFGDSPELVNEFLEAFKDVRRVQAFGSFLGAMKEAEEETREEEHPETEKPGDLIGCSCGMCRWRDVHWSSELIHISQTILAFDGTRQLRLFDSGADPPCEIVNGTDNSTAIALRAVQRTPTLFDVAPLAF